MDTMFQVRPGKACIPSSHKHCSFPRHIKGHLYIFPPSWPQIQVQSFQGFQSRLYIAHVYCNHSHDWNCGASRANCHWNSLEFCGSNNLITGVIAVQCANRIRNPETTVPVTMHPCNYATVGSGTSEGLPSGGESLNRHSLVLLVPCSTEHCAPDLHAKQAKVTAL